jgi:hypothetical protein
VHQFPRITRCRHDVEPSPGDMLARLHAEDAVGKRVTPVVIIEEPCVNTSVAQRGLEPSQVHGEILLRCAYCMAHGLCTEQVESDTPHVNLAQ